ncbi:MAG TPA: electron transfer flavoprotein subunit alpha/FixB family protein [Lachnospiraceae bacterium]|jgi:electron transfer flavoprotein alpha subunit|nr:electron transfer flavoprotein subunit alpha/FixB family protein [Lachnospiraceae bacterium]
MADILVYSQKADLALELQTAAITIANGKAVKTLMINQPYEPTELTSKGANIYQIAQENINLYDVGMVAEAIRLAAIQLDCDTILLSSDRRGRELAGRLAQKMNAGCITDISSLKLNGDIIIGSRNALGGAVVAEQTIKTDIKVLAIAPKSFPQPEAAIGGIQEINISTVPTGVRFINSQPKPEDTVDISEAEVLLVIGMGIEDQSDLISVKEIAETINGEIACSKPVATDKKWFGEDKIIGISGKTCRPKLGILLGISGQVQFWAGIRDAQTIVAINNDENAMIMNMADYALVADVKDVLPQLKKLLG